MNQSTNARDDTHCPRCEFGQLKALYRLNVLAKEYAQSAEEAYNAGAKERARIHSERKKALYSLKRAILGEFIENGCVDEIRAHEIDDRPYYCVYVDEFSFHTPTSEWEESELPQDAPEATVELDDFNADPDSRSKDLTEREALTRLTDQFESPNNHLNVPFTDNDYRSTFIGWSYLPGALEVGDRVPERHLLNHRGEDDFVFEIGDAFQTGEGECEIIDRYHAYLEPYYDRSPLLQRPAYDVLLDGDEKRECITEEEMNESWNILADSISDPLPNVDGELSELAGSGLNRVEEPIKFEIGDILELQWDTDEEPMYNRLAEVHVSRTLLIGQCEPVPPSDDSLLGRTIEEVADIVVAVHDEPPADH